jgi:hypothetical protein
MLRLKLFPAVFFILPAAAVLVTQATPLEAASEECRAKPDSSAPIGSRWYYRVDRAHQRRCWFLSSGDSRMRRVSSLRHRELVTRSTGGENSQPFELSDTTEATRRQYPVVLPDEQTHHVSLVPESDALISEGLVPHKVTSLSFVQTRAGERSLTRKSNSNWFLLCGTLATGLLVAGGALQVVGRIRRSSSGAWQNLKSLWSMRAKRSKSATLSSKAFATADAKLNKVREYLRRSNIPSLQLTETPSHSQQLH